ncbi:hypothetical protein IWX49DRAFT_103123 [Phyllosticta citricarpa]
MLLAGCGTLRAHSPPVPEGACAQSSSASLAGWLAAAPLSIPSTRHAMTDRPVCSHDSPTHPPSSACTPPLHELPLATQGVYIPVLCCCNHALGAAAAARPILLCPFIRFFYPISLLVVPPPAPPSRPPQSRDRTWTSRCHHRRQDASSSAGK